MGGRKFTNYYLRKERIKQLLKNDSSITEKQINKELLKCYFDNELFQIELKKTTKNKKK
ncbi:hypothetical protein LCGC14_1205450 [marine sediment metagenome]|uniref:Uncharacterized protein n=1 Tax=marine sediment metagenome TaxID=412755 RepID=A0A0F9LK39_9ZZZZ